MTKYKKSIIWLASYPKSGNTWVRIFLSRILFKTNNINNLNIPIYSSKTFLEEQAFIDISELPLEDIHSLRLEVYSEKAKYSDFFPIKIHDIFQKELYNKPFLPFEYSKVVIYIIRNPFDVAISFAKHLGKSIDETISIMNETGYTLSKNTYKYQVQLPQPLGSWSNHVKSWTSQSLIPFFVVRYEDLLYNTKTTFEEILKNCKIPYNSDTLTDAINFSKFENLKKHEQQYGFNEKSIHLDNFFNVGKAYYYKDILTNSQIKKIYESNKELIIKYNYEL